MAFWRGRDSRRERLDLVKMSDKHRDIIDAELNAMFFFKKEQDDFKIAKRVSFYDFFQVCNIVCFVQKFRNFVIQNHTGSYVSASQHRAQVEQQVRSGIL